MMWSLLAVAALAWTTTPPLNVNDDARRVGAAIVAAVRERVGMNATVTIDELLVLQPVDATHIRAVPDPAARLGQPIRFTIESAPADRVGTTRGGRAQAIVRVVVDHAHALRPIERGHDLQAGDVTPARHAVETGLLRPLPTLDEAGRSRARRDLAAGACLERSALAVAPAVRAGDEVVATAWADGARVAATMVAAQNGEAGAVIRVVNASSRRSIKARVVSAGLVEIVHD